MTLLELPSGYENGLSVRGVSLSYDDQGRRGAVVTCLKVLQRAAAPLVLNTPHLGEDVLPPELLRGLSALVHEAARYANGYREQGNLFEGEGAEDEEPWDQGPEAHYRPALVE